MTGEVGLADGAERRGELQLGAGLGGGGCGRRGAMEVVENAREIHAKSMQTSGKSMQNQETLSKNHPNPIQNPCKIREIPMKLEGTC